MEFTFNQIDLSKTANPPGDIIRLRPGDRWYVPNDAYQLGKSVEWRMYRRGEHVYVPLVPYLTAADVQLAQAFMLQLGVSLALSLPVPCQRLHVAIGTPVNSVVEGTAQYWQTHVGFAFLAER